VTSDGRMTWGLIIDVLGVLERHGYRKLDNQHTGQAVGVIFDLARVYEGTGEHTAGAHPTQVPPSLPAHPQPSGQAGQDAVTLADGDVHTVLAALDIAADHKRDRAEMCADCADQSCLTCQSRLRDAQAYDGMAGRLAWAAEAARAANASQPEPDPRPQPAADREAGQ